MYENCIVQINCARLFNIMTNYKTNGKTFRSALTQNQMALQATTYLPEGQAKRRHNIHYKIKASLLNINTIWFCPIIYIMLNRQCYIIKGT